MPGDDAVVLTETMMISHLDCSAQWVCNGWGVGISIQAPTRIATDNTLFAMPKLHLDCFLMCVQHTFSL